MPHSPPTPCRETGCPALSYTPRCSLHTKERQHVYDRQRGTTKERGYAGEWFKIRRDVLREEPACRRCGGPASEVDHIIPKRSGGTNERANLQGLCGSCHSSKTVRETQWGRRREGE